MDNYSIVEYVYVSSNPTQEELESAFIYGTPYCTNTAGTLEIRIFRADPANIIKLCGYYQEGQTRPNHVFMIEGTPTVILNMFEIRFSQGSNTYTYVSANANAISQYGDYAYADSMFGFERVPSYRIYNNLQECLVAMAGPLTPPYSITYRDTNCVSSGPTEASVGDVVQVDYTFPDGYGIVNPSTDIYVTNNGVVVPSSYSNGTLTFTMPDPS